MMRCGGSLLLTLEGLYFDGDMPLKLKDTITHPPTHPVLGLLACLSNPAEYRSDIILLPAWWGPASSCITPSSHRTVMRSHFALN